MKNRYEIRGDVTAIFIEKRNGEVVECLIDSSDLHIVDSYFGKWYQNKQGYIAIEIREPHRTSVTMHRVLMEFPKEKLVDHINRVKHDNRKSINLRMVTKSQNGQNQSYRSKNKSGYRGVYWNPRYQVWQVRVELDGKSKTYGTYKDVHEAGRKAIEVRAKKMPYSPEARNEKLS